MKWNEIKIDKILKESLKEYYGYGDDIGITYCTDDTGENTNICCIYVWLRGLFGLNSKHLKTINTSWEEIKAQLNLPNDARLEWKFDGKSIHELVMVIKDE